MAVNLFTLTEIFNGQCVAYDNSSNIYFYSSNIGAIVKINKNGGIPIIFATAEFTASSSGCVLGFDSTFTYLYAVVSTPPSTKAAYKYDLIGNVTTLSYTPDTNGVGVVLSDSSDNIYYISTNGSKIMKYNTTTNTETTFINIGSTIGFIGKDSTGNIYSGNFSSPNIIQINSSGSIVDATFITAGSGSFYGMGFNSSGNIFVVTDTGMNRYSSDGTSISVPYISYTQFLGPNSIVFDSSGNLYTLGGSGIVTTKSLGSTLNNFSTGYGMLSPSLTYDGAGYLYIYDFTDNSVHKVDTSNGNNTVFSTSATNYMYQFCYNQANSTLYAIGADNTTGIVSIYSYNSGGTQSLLYSTGSTNNGYIALNTSGNIYFTDGSDPLKVYLYNTTTTSVTLFYDYTSTGITNLSFLAVDNNTGYLYVAYLASGHITTNGDPDTIDKLNSAGTIIASAFITNPGGFISISVDPSGNIFTTGQQNVNKYSSSGTPISVPYFSITSSDSIPLGYAGFDNSGNLYITYGTEILSTTSGGGGGGGALCFKEGSKILCLQGTEEEYLEIQNIRKNMLVKTGQSGYKRVDKIGTTVLYNDHSNKNCLDNLYICKRDDYPELTEDLVITGAHSILVNTMTEKQKEASMRIFGDVYVTENKYRLAACIDPRAKPYDVKEKVNIWHLSLEHTNKLMNYGIYANGLLVESASKRMMTEISGMKLV